jgi:hypothetical protein
LKTSEWKQRAEAVALDRQTLASILGQPPETVSKHWLARWAGGTPHYVKAVIVAWELMTPKMRKEWQARLGED